MDLQLFLVVVGIACRLTCMLGQCFKDLSALGFSGSKILLLCLLAYIVYREKSTVHCYSSEFKNAIFFGCFLLESVIIMDLKQLHCVFLSVVFLFF